MVTFVKSKKAYVTFKCFYEIMKKRMLIIFG